MNARTYANLGNDARSVLAIIGGIVAALVFLLVWFGVARWQKYENAMDSFEPRIARLIGALQEKDKITDAREEIAASVAHYAYRSQTDLTRTESELQSRVRDILQSTGLEIVNTQQLPAKSGNGYDEISLSLSANGGLTQLQEALSMLRMETPRIRVELIRLQPVVRGGSTEQSLSIQLTLAAIRLREG